jgi:hypothetical protein
MAWRSSVQTSQHRESYDHLNRSCHHPIKVGHTGNFEVVVYKYVVGSGVAIGQGEWSVLFVALATLRRRLTSAPARGDAVLSPSYFRRNPSPERLARMERIAAEAPARAGRFLKMNSAVG